jgi:hypothetical protein
MIETLNLLTDLALSGISVYYLIRSISGDPEERHEWLVLGVLFGIWATV